MKKNILFILLICSINLYAQDVDSLDYYKTNHIRYDNSVYKDYIRTVILSRALAPLSNPIIILNSGEKLNLQFDDLSGEAHNYSYKYIHCEANWRPSLLSEMDYLKGFLNDNIAIYQPSFSTLQPFYHYSLDFPNDLMSPTISGNYLLIVYQTENEENIVLTRRFWVTENKVTIEANVHRATDPALAFSHQEVDFKLVTGTLKIANPYKDIKVKIVQNGFWEGGINDLKPLIAYNNELDYNLENGNVFKAGNEFRVIDIRTTKFETPTTERLFYDNAARQFTVFLKPDRSRSSERYSFIEDINGRFQIKNYEARDSDLESDYIKTIIRLPMSEPIEGGNLYLYGGLTNWQIVPWARLHYDTNDSTYKSVIFLKQGYYNYQYLFLPDGKVIPEVADLEGSHYETQNDYEFYIYWRDEMGRYDRLVAYKMSSNNLK